MTAITRRRFEQNRLSVTPDPFPAASLGFSFPNALEERTDAVEAVLTRLEELLDRLARIEAAVDVLVSQKTVKEWYSTDEVAVLLGKAPFTVREWCRNARVNAAKRDCGRGESKQWIISHSELRRIQNEGLLPTERPYRHCF